MSSGNTNSILPPTWSQIQAGIQNQANGCWIWVGLKNPQGYGRVSRYARDSVKKNFSIHRVAYEAIKGPIQAGMVIDHLCRNKACCNPEHLEAVTSRENILRGVGASALNAKKTHCINGHEFSIQNTLVRKNGSNLRRVCRQCRRIRDRLRDQRRRLDRLCARQSEAVPTA